MSREGISLVQQYISTEDKQVHDPKFNAQYLLVPVNTIVKNSLAPWMMKFSIPEFRKKNVDMGKNETYKARQQKV